MPPVVLDSCSWHFGQLMRRLEKENLEPFETRLFLAFLSLHYYIGWGATPSSEKRRCVLARNIGTSNRQGFHNGSPYY